MAEKSLEFVFNTALWSKGQETTARNSDSQQPETWSAHFQQQLTERLSRLDGVFDVVSFKRGFRYGFVVKYYDEVTSQDDVVQHVQLVVAEVADLPGAFPLRQIKIPQARLEGVKPSYLRWMVAELNTHVAKLPVDDNGGTDPLAFAQNTAPLARELIDLDGVKRHQINLSRVSVQYDTRIVGSETVNCHLRDVLRRFVAEERRAQGYFPYLGERSLGITFRETDTV